MRIGLPAEIAQQHVATYAQANVVQVTTELILAAIDLHRLAIGADRRWSDRRQRDAPAVGFECRHQRFGEGRVMVRRVRGRRPSVGDLGRQLLVFRSEGA